MFGKFTPRMEFKRPKDWVTVDPEFPGNVCKILEHGYHEILNGNLDSVCLHDLDRHARDMVQHKYEDELYTLLVKSLTFKLQEVATSVEGSYQGTLFLKDLHGKWMEHIKALQLLMGLLTQLDRTCVHSTDKTPVYELGLNLWRDIIIHSCNIQTRLKDTLHEIMQQERDGAAIDRGVMRNIVKMLMDLGPSVYQQDFEKPFIDVSTNFYQRKSQQLIECCDYGDYLNKTEMLLNEEIEQTSHYLDAQSKVKVTNVVEKEMIESHMTRLIHMENSGLVNMIMDDNYEDLSRMYNIFRRAPDGLTLIRNAMASHVWEIGKQLVTDPERLKDPVGFVQCLLDEKDKHDNIINLAFNNDQTFQMALDSIFKHFINSNPRSAEFTSLFLDEKLRKELIGATEVAVNILLDKVLTLFRYLQDKDAFEKYYKEHLSKRLLGGNSISNDDAERSLILKLKAVCGYQFTKNLEGMCTRL